MNEVDILEAVKKFFCDICRDHNYCFGCHLGDGGSPCRKCKAQDYDKQLSSHYDKLAYDKAVGCLPMKVDKVIGHLAHNAIISDMEHELAIAFNQKEVKNG